MKKNIFLLLIVFVVVFLSLSCALQGESGKTALNIPEIYHGEWQTFDSNTGTMILEIRKDHIWQYAKGYENHIFDVCLAMKGTKEIFVSEYEYKQINGDSSITLKYSPETEILTFDSSLSNGTGISTRYRYYLKRK